MVQNVVVAAAPQSDKFGSGRFNVPFLRLLHEPYSCLTISGRLGFGRGSRLLPASKSVAPKTVSFDTWGIIITQMAELSAIEFPNQCLRMTNLNEVPAPPNRIGNIPSLRSPSSSPVPPRLQPNDRLRGSLMRSPMWLPYETDPVIYRKNQLGHSSGVAYLVTAQ